MATHPFPSTEILAISGQAGRLAVGLMPLNRMADARINAAAYCLDAPCCVPTGASTRPDEYVVCTQLRAGE